MPFQVFKKFQKVKRDRHTGHLYFKFANSIDFKMCQPPQSLHYVFKRAFQMGCIFYFHNLSQRLSQASEDVWLLFGSSLAKPQVSSVCMEGEWF